MGSEPQIVTDPPEQHIRICRVRDRDVRARAGGDRVTHRQIDTIRLGGTGPRHQGEPEYQHQDKQNRTPDNHQYLPFSLANAH